jgi:excisionase family DNA binding protein
MIPNLQTAIDEVASIYRLPDCCPETMLEHCGQIVRVATDGLFAAGHTDLYRRGVPLSAMAEPLDALVYLRDCLTAIDKPSLLTVAQVAAALNVSPGTIYRLIESGKLRHSRFGSGRGTIRIRPEDLDQQEPLTARGPSSALRAKYLGL